MNPHFYHWHGRVEIKPDEGILEKRWASATKYSEKLTADQVAELIKMILLEVPGEAFAKQMTEALVAIDPMFPISQNGELLRVMATAVADVRFEHFSPVSSVLGLGLRAGAFPVGRARAVCQDIVDRGELYLSLECERVRPAANPVNLDKAEKAIAGQLATLKAAAEKGVVSEVGTATWEFGKSVFAALKESHNTLGSAVNRIREESQFMWWLLGHRSNLLDTQRGQLTAEAYALSAATEAAQRVAIVPPPASVEAILHEVLTQCSSGPDTPVSVVSLVKAAAEKLPEAPLAQLSIAEFLPITTLLSECRNGAEPRPETLKKYGFTAKQKLAPGLVSQQYFRELMFRAAFEKLG